jgi:phosphoenolpyruvate carboxylase
MADHQLPHSLKKLVNNSVTLLGEVIREQEGDDFYQIADKLREQMVIYRHVNTHEYLSLLEQHYQVLQTYDIKQQQQLVHSFSLMMQLINACEAAYRSHRLQQHTEYKQPKTDNKIVFVLTAHPTEARSFSNIYLFQQIRHCCQQLLTQETCDTVNRLKHLLKLAWLTPIAKHRRPGVQQEAETIFSTVLRQDIIEQLIRIYKEQADIRIRTWVGGDKDGHPGVDEKVMLSVLNLARRNLVNIVLSKLDTVYDTFKILPFKKKQLSKRMKENKVCLHRLSHITVQEHQLFKEFHKKFQKLCQDYTQQIGQLHPALEEIVILLQLFPALVVPIELREDATCIRNALCAKQKLAIERMLLTIAEITTMRTCHHYIKGFIISMTESKSDIDAALTLVQKTLGHARLRIVPLFETQQALQKASHIVEQCFNNKVLLNKIRKQWNNKFEVMLGYSDSAKTMGVFASRLQIAKVMHQLDVISAMHHVEMIFFHGAGGSVDRGGGSIKEQTSWWPQSAFLTCKTTIQGEMVERNFASPEIVSSSINKLILEADKKHVQTWVTNHTIELFMQNCTCAYQKKINDPEFLQVIDQTTLYPFLDKLRIGSRPSKRRANLSLTTLRAIPWVMCWTQTRVLFPTWWGIGTAWRMSKDKQRQVTQLKKIYQQNTLFRSFVKLLGFTLSKVDLPIWFMYLRHSTLPNKLVVETMVEFEEEFQSACDFVYAMSGYRHLMWFRPWLKQSIALRASMINPLNLLQLIAIKNNDIFLIRETATGIASGMLTTG